MSDINFNGKDYSTVVDEYLEMILKAAGTSLRHHTSTSKHNLRAAMAAVLNRHGDELQAILDQKKKEIFDEYDRGMAELDRKYAESKAESKSRLQAWLKESASPAPGAMPQTKERVE